jgi:hypothetical protein
VRVNGQDAAPVYKFLKASKPGFFGSRIKWNFTKFLVGKDGKVIARYATLTTPLSIEVSLSLSLDGSLIFFLSLSLESLIFCISFFIGFEFTEGHPEGS